MSDAALYSAWFFWLTVAAVIVVAAAVLLILVWFAARRILKLAGRALDLVHQIKANTAPIWALEETNKSASRILHDAQRIRMHGASVAQTLHEGDSARGN